MFGQRDETFDVDKLREFSSNPQLEAYTFSEEMSGKKKKLISTCDRYDVSYKLENKGVTIKKVRRLQVTGLKVIEIFATSAMKSAKLRALKEADIPWIEVLGKPSLFAGKNWKKKKKKRKEKEQLKLI
jgi:hypothetical protein